MSCFDSGFYLMEKGDKVYTLLNRVQNNLKVNYPTISPLPYTGRPWVKPGLQIYLHGLPSIYKKCEFVVNILISVYCT